VRWPRRVLGAILGALALAGPASAAAPAPTPAARAYILVEPASGAVLAQRLPDQPLPMASTTKIMTALLTLERLPLEREVAVPEEAAAIGGSTSELVPGERLSVRDLLLGLLIPSGNDAAITLADAVSGSQGAFVQLMNRRADELGLSKTHFETPHGLDRPNHHASVRDLVELARAAMAHPEFRRIVAMRRAVIPGPLGRGERVLVNENLLLSIDPDADGVKTGHTTAAGYSLVAHARRAALGVELYAAFIGEPSERRRAEDARSLLDWGFAQYARSTLLPGGQVIGRASVLGRPGVWVGFRTAAAVAAPFRLGEPLTEVLAAPAAVRAPIAAGQRIGTVAVRQGGRVLGRTDLVAERGVDGPGMLDRLRAALDGLF
jgi:serine-type D-Ala-D-Ala carboxypeptidase (penicillin-binding protein 5/6)